MSFDDTGTGKDEDVDQNDGKILAQDSVHGPENGIDKDNKVGRERNALRIPCFYSGRPVAETRSYRVLPPRFQEMLQNS